ARRAGLARIALAQGRFDDAWDHFAATGGAPEICAALLPGFLPGVAIGSAPEGVAVGPGGIVGALPDGVLLAPASPPPAVAAAPDAALFRAAGPALASVLGFAVATKSAPSAVFPGVKIDLGDPGLARRKFLGMVTLSERFALRPAPR